MFLHATLHRISRLWILFVLAGLLAGIGLGAVQNPGLAARPARPARQDIYCDSYHQTGALWYTQIVTQVLYPPSGNWDIYRTDPCSPYNDRVRLTTSPAFDGYPRFNTDATRVVFVSERDGNAEIYSMNADGSGQTRLTDSPAVDTAPAYSPDGTKIAFVSERDGSAEIYLMNADGSGQTRLTSNDAPDYDPGWSPDGKHIAWVQGPDAARRVYIMDADGGGQSALSAPYKNARRPVWSPLGDRLALEADDNQDGWQDLVEISADGTGALVLPIAKFVSPGYGEDFLMGGWMTSGQNLIFTRAIYYFSGGERKLKSAELALTSLTGGAGVVDGSVDPSFYPSVAISDPYPPVTTLQPLPAYLDTNTHTLKWSITDSGPAGIDQYVLESRSLPDGAWNQMCYGSCPEATVTDQSHWSGSISFAGTAGTRMAYRIQAWDKAGNQAAPPAEVEITFYAVKMEGQITDTRGYPLPSAQVEAGDGVIASAPVDAQGRTTLYFKAGGPAQASFSAPGYGSYPPQTWPLDGNGHFLSVLPPAENLLANGDFESPFSALSGWQTGGDLLAQPGPSLSGARAALLGSLCADHICFAPAEPVHLASYYGSDSLVIDADGTAHLLASVYSYPNYLTYYYNRPRDGAWAAGELLADVDGASKLMIAGDGTLFFTFRSHSTLVDSLARRPRGGAWTYEAIPSLNTSTFGYNSTVDSAGQFHLVYQHTLNGAQYLRRLADGTWAGPFHLTIDFPYSSNRLQALLASSPDGALHIVYQLIYSSYPEKPRYARLAADGALVDDQPLPPGYQLPYMKAFAFSANGVGHLLGIYDGYSSDSTLYWQLPAGGVWSEPQFITYAPVNTSTLLASPNGDLHIPSGNRYYYKPAGADRFSVWTIPFSQVVQSAALDERGQLALVARDNTNVNFFHLAPPQASGQAVLQQTVSIPAELPNPTLSFRYKFDQEFAGPASGMQVILTPDGGSPTVIFNAPGERGVWLHAWADLSAWAGQTVTVAFRLDQAAGEWHARLLLEEVSLGGWNTPVIQALSPDTLAPEAVAVTPLRLSGINLVGGARVLVGEQPVAQVREDPATGDLLVTLPADLPPGAYAVRIVYPDGRSALAPRLLRLGHFLYFSSIYR